MIRVLVACEFSGRVRDAFLAKGHDAWSCDILPTEVEGPGIIGIDKMITAKNRKILERQIAIWELDKEKCQKELDRLEKNLVLARKSLQ